MRHAAIDAARNAAVAVVFLLGAWPAHAGDEAQGEEGILPIPEYGGDIWTRDWLTDGWDGKRREWAGKGLQLQVDWIQTLQSIVDGGRATRTHYGGSLDYLLHVDLYRMGLVPGAMVKVRAESRYGRSVNSYSGSILPVSLDGMMPLTRTLDDDIFLTITSLAYYQFLSEEFGVFAGKVDFFDSDPNEFASGRGNTQFMNFNFVFNAATALLPYSTLAAGALWLPNENTTVSAVFFNTKDSSTSSGFDDFGDGWSLATEADFQYRLRELPGGQNLGFSYSGDDTFFNFNGRFTFAPGEGLVPPTSDSTWVIYWSGWQYLHTTEDANGPLDLTNGKPDLRGVGAFWRVGFGDDDTNPTKFSASVGLGGRGLIPTRENDTFGLGYYYSQIQTTRLTGILGLTDHVQGFECFYNLAVTPAAQVTFDLQLINSAATSLDTSVVLGIRVFVNF